MSRVAARRGDRDLDQLRQIGRGRAGADAEQAAIGERPVEGVDLVGEAALLAHFVPKPRGQSAAEHLGEHMRRVEAPGP